MDRSRNRKIHNLSLGLRVTLSEQKKKRVSDANQKYLRKIGENEQQYYTRLRKAEEKGKNLESVT